MIQGEAVSAELTKSSDPGDLCENQEYLDIFLHMKDAIPEWRGLTSVD